MQKKENFYQEIQTALGNKIVNIGSDRTTVAHEQKYLRHVLFTCGFNRKSRTDPLILPPPPPHPPSTTIWFAKFVRQIADLGGSQLGLTASS